MISILVLKKSIVIGRVSSLASWISGEVRYRKVLPGKPSIIAKEFSPTPLDEIGRKAFGLKGTFSLENFAGLPSGAA